MEPHQLQLVIMTVDRPPHQYVHRTLASLFASDPLVHRLPPVRLMVGTNDASYLDGYRHHRRLQVRPLSDAEWEQVRGWTVHRRLNHNFHRCLTTDLGDAAGVCVCEDDLKFRDGFVSALLAAVGEVGQSHARYVLAAYAAYDLDREPAFARGEHYCSYGHPFYGNQCVYYPRTVLAELAELVLEQGVRRYTEPADLLVKRLDERHQFLYATRRSLVQHIGEHSTGVGHHHTSPTFDP